ncbi:MAG: hypothetical protein HYS13_03490 [Planctomycetia bacterium]|nr:hypothetical protein [Planctomycetia bacterium]
MTAKVMERFRCGWRHDVLLFLAVALGYVAWRAPGELVWDDSLAVCENADPKTGESLDRFDRPGFLAGIWNRDFGGLHVDGYRPLNWAVRRIGSALCHEWPGAGMALAVFNGVVAGLLAVSFFRLARRFTATAGGAHLAVFLLLASTPILTGLLVLFAGIQALVPLAMCTTLNCYFAAEESRRRWPWLLAMGVLLFIAPLYREFAGLTSILLLFLEMQRGRWRSAVSVMAAATFVLALFPTLLPHVAFFPGLPVEPVYELGVLQKQLTAGAGESSLLSSATEMMKRLHWRILLDVPSLLPPTLCVLGAAGWVVVAVRRKAAVMPWRGPCFLAFFFLVTFLPFLKLFKEQVHLAYCLAPASILLAASLEALWRTVEPSRTALRVILGGLLLLTICDHALNVIVVRGATRGSYAAIDRVAQSCLREMPEGSLMLTNSHHGMDLQYRTAGRFPCYFSTITAANRVRLIDSANDLESLRQMAGEADVFCVDVRLPKSRRQRGPYRAHWVVRDRPGELEAFGSVERVSYRYPVLDPLKLLLPTQNTAWPCSPDLEFDYYRGPALDRTPFLREVAVSFHLFRLVDPAAHSQRPDTGEGVRDAAPRPNAARNASLAR